MQDLARRHRPAEREAVRVQHHLGSDLSCSKQKGRLGATFKIRVAAQRQGSGSPSSAVL
jgi:hypothetical protein